MTGSRAEWGLLSGLARKITDDPELELQIIATNMHLSPEFGLTYREIERQGFRINRKVEMLLSSDSANATGKSVGLATIGFADAYEELAPDMLLVLGDRYEILAAVTAALFYKIPVAHLHGGEVTEGAYDDEPFAFYIDGGIPEAGHSVGGATGTGVSCGGDRDR